MGGKDPEKSCAEAAMVVAITMAVAMQNVRVMSPPEIAKSRIALIALQARSGENKNLP